MKISNACTRRSKKLQPNCHVECVKRKWWAVTGSNRRPSRCKRDALPTELTALDPPLNAFRSGLEPLNRAPRETPPDKAGGGNDQRPIWITASGCAPCDNRARLKAISASLPGTKRRGDLCLEPPRRIGIELNAPPRPSHPRRGRRELAAGLPSIRSAQAGA